MKIDSQLAHDGRPVFIIGGSRTGSTMLKTVLHSSPEIDLTDEMHYFNVPWLSRSVAANIRKHVGPLDAAQALDKLMTLLYSGTTEGWFWSETERLLDRDMLQCELSSRPLNLQNIFHAIIVVHARMRNRQRIGAKFPLHYSYTDKLLEWYPDCLLLHTTRNPKAVYASQGKKYVSDDQSMPARAYMRFRQFVHINIQISWTASLHKRLHNLPNYRLVQYEEMVLNPEAEISSICDFLQIEYLPDMLMPKRYGSSYENPGVVGKGIETSSLQRWQSSIHPATAKIIDLTHRKATQILGYDVDG